VRSLLPDLLDEDALRSAYAVESSALELAFILGPPLALGLGALWSTSAALFAAGLVLVLATAGFATHPASRSWRPAPTSAPGRAGSLRAPTIQTLVLVLSAVGGVFGAVDVGVTAAAGPLGGTSIAGPLLALWGLGSLAGGVLTARLGGGARSGHGLALVLLALAAGHLLLSFSSKNVLLLGAGLAVAGAAIAPTYASIYSMVDQAAPAGTVTEAFAWLATAVAAGNAAGAAAAGVLVQRGGPSSAFLLAGAAGAGAVLVAVARRRTLPARAPRARGRALCPRTVRREAVPSRNEVGAREAQLDGRQHIVRLLDGVSTAH
jgi:predicted MFS family arabinose efflux permease